MVLNDKVTRADLDRRKCYVNDSQFPLFYKPIINDIVADGMPIVCVHGDTGSGKSEASARLGYDLHERVGVCLNDFQPSNNIHFHPLPYLKRLRSSNRQALIMEEAGVNLKSSDWNQLTNKKNDNAMQLARILNHVLIYVSPHHSDLDNRIRKNCSVKIVARNKIDEYIFDVYRVIQDNKNEVEDREEKHIQSWKPKRPPKNIRETIEVNSKERKLEILDEDIKELERQVALEKMEAEGEDTVKIGV